MSPRPARTAVTVAAAALAAAGVVGPLTMPTAAEATVATPAGPGYSLAFADEFNGSAVDTKVWNYRGDVKASSAQLPQNVTVGSGLLTIHLRKQYVAGKRYTGGGLISKAGYRYGYYETRAKTNVGAGWHTAFWAQRGNGSDTYNTQRRTEIDGFEIDSHAPRQVRHNIHPWNADGSEDDVITRLPYDVGFDTSAAWHTYGFDWRENEVRYYVDGKLAFTAPYDPLSRTAHDYINIWLTTIAFAPIDDSKLPGAVQFDYVRFYLRDYYVDNDGPASYGYSEKGAWSASNLRGFTLENTTRTSNAVGASATWQPKLREGGRYAVYVHKVARPGNDTAARYTVHHSGGRSSASVNQAQGKPGWVKLGTWKFAPDASTKVVVSRSNGNLRTDAVKFIRM